MRIKKAGSRLGLHFFFVLVFLGALVLPAAGALAQTIEPIETSIDIGHAHLNALLWQSELWNSGSGNGETVLALPGSGADVSRYKYIGPLLAEAGYRFVAINQRGIMGSTGSLEGLDLHDYGDDIVGVIDSFDLDKVHMLGWALGNRIARVLATDHPQRVATTSLIAAGGLVPALTEPGELGQLLGNRDLSTAEKERLARRTLFSPASDESLIKEYVEGLNYWSEARASQTQANRSTPTEQWWAGGSGPMLIIQGLDDKTAPPENGILMKEEFGERITLVNLPNAGHAMGLEKPAETASALISFLREHPIQ